MAPIVNTLVQIVLLGLSCLFFVFLYNKKSKIEKISGEHSGGQKQGYKLNVKLCFF